MIRRIGLCVKFRLAKGHVFRKIWTPIGRGVFVPEGPKELGQIEKQKGRNILEASNWAQISHPYAGAEGD
jgi:hypothetical protein